MIETVAVSGRTLRPWWDKINPIWWFGNDSEPDPPSWYLPTRPLWWRYVFWYLRNPFMNFLNYVVGVSDRNFNVTGPAPVMVTEWADIGDSRRWKWSLIRLPIPLPFVSYSGKRVLWHVGWEPGGCLQVKFNIVNHTKP
jgi:hypothetical protein